MVSFWLTKMKNLQNSNEMMRTWPTYVDLWWLCCGNDAWVVFHLVLVMFSETWLSETTFESSWFLTRLQLGLHLWLIFYQHSRILANWSEIGVSGRGLAGFFSNVHIFVTHLLRLEQAKGSTATGPLYSDNLHSTLDELIRTVSNNSKSFTMSLVSNQFRNMSAIPALRDP